MSLFRKLRGSTAAPSPPSPAAGAGASKTQPAGGALLVGFDEKSVESATQLQRLARGRSARRLVRQVTASLTVQRTMAMDLLASELVYLNKLTELRESFEVPLRAAPPPGTLSPSYKKRPLPPPAVWHHRYEPEGSG